MSNYSEQQQQSLEQKALCTHFSSTVPGSLGSSQRLMRANEFTYEQQLGEPNVDKVLTYLPKVKISGQCKAGNEDV